MPIEPFLDSLKWDACLENPGPHPTILQQFLVVTWIAGILGKALPQVLKYNFLSKFQEHSSPYGQIQVIFSLFFTKVMEKLAGTSCLRIETPRYKATDCSFHTIMKNQTIPLFIVNVTIWISLTTPSQIRRDIIFTDRVELNRIFNNSLLIDIKLDLRKTE